MTFKGTYDPSGTADQNRSLELARHGRAEEALEYATKAVQRFMSDLRTIDAAAPFLGKAMINRSQCLADCGRLEEALRYSRDALAHYGSWAATMPQMRPDLALLHSMRARWLHRAGDHTAAVDSWGESVSQWAALATGRYGRQVPAQAMPADEVYVSTLADTLRSYAEALYAHRRDRMEEALDATFPYETLTGHPVSRLKALAAAALQEAEQSSLRGDTDGAVRHLNFAVAHHLRLYLTDHHQGTGLITAYFNLLNIYANVDNDPVRALEAAEHAGRVGREIHARDPQRYTTLYANTLQWHAEVLRALGRQAEAQALLDRVRVIAPHRQDR